MRRYYSVRTGKNAGGIRFSLEQFRALFHAAYQDFLEKDYFQESFGYWCVDEKDVNGKLGANIPGKIMLQLRKSDLWPIAERIDDYTEDDIFDMIEFLHDHVSKPVDGHYHSYGSCGYHYSSFDEQSGQSEFRGTVNAFLHDYGDGFELSSAGEILTVGEPGLATLENAALPHLDPDNVERRVDAAVSKYRRFRSSMEDRRDAIRDLADVLEFLRPKLKQVLASKDEADSSTSRTTLLSDITTESRRKTTTKASG